MINKVISGGQTGADQSALKAAKECGLQTGGWLPAGCVTLEGPRPDLLVEYSMQEHPKGYAYRTEANVRDSDGTVRFAKTFKSPGEICTMKAIRWFGKPHFDVDIAKPPDPKELMDWMAHHNISTLNVAGNSEQTAPGISQFVHDFLVRTFDRQ